MAAAVAPFVQEYENAPLPPVAETLAVPLAFPLQKTGVEVAVAAKAEAGCVMVFSIKTVQPFASVTVAE